MAWNPMVEGSSVCVCWQIDHNACRDLVRAGKVQSLEDLKAQTKAATKCALCAPYFEAIIEMYKAEAAQH